MRKLTARDLGATLIIAAVVVPFIGYSVRGSMPFVQDPRGMAGVVIVGALLTFAALGRRAFGTGTYEWVMVTLGVLTLGFAIAALIAETVWALLVPAMAGLVLLWALALLHDVGYLAREHTAGQGKPQRAVGRVRLAGPTARDPDPTSDLATAQAGPCASRRTRPQSGGGDEPSTAWSAPLRRLALTHAATPQPDPGTGSRAMSLRLPAPGARQATVKEHP